MSIRKSTLADVLVWDCNGTLAAQAITPDGTKALEGTLKGELIGRVMYFTGKSVMSDAMDQLDSTGVVVFPV